MNRRTATHLLVVVAIVGLLPVGLATAHDGRPSGVGWVCFALLVVGALWYGQKL